MPKEKSKNYFSFIIGHLSFGHSRAAAQLSATLRPRGRDDEINK
jgi:hypothetical protein